MGLPAPGDFFLGKYRLEQQLGKGGMGVVYAARHELLGQRVAVKFVLPAMASDSTIVARFLNEARAAARIESDHVARVFDVGVVDDAMPYMVLELLEGEDLEVVLEKRGPLPVAEVVDYLLQASEALAHAHALGIVHRDLKPSNLFLARRRDGKARIKVLDFGIAKMMSQSGAVASNITKTSAVFGSPLYMSPEQLRDSKNVDHRCDIWALGVIAYELLTCHPPFVGDNPVALFDAIQRSAPPSLLARRADGAVSRELEAVLLRCLRRVESERYASVTELAAALAPFATAQGRQSTATLVSAASSSASMIVTAPQATAFANTAIPWSSTTVGARPPPVSPRSRAPFAAVAAIGVLGLVGLLASGYSIVHRRPSELRAANSAPPDATATFSAVTAEALKSAAPIASSTAPALAPSASSPAVASAGAPAIAVAPRPRPTSAASVPVVAPASSARAAPPVPNCDPPYTINAAGHHVLKPECQ
jgi:serine/threonine-protein kinase